MSNDLEDGCFKRSIKEVQDWEYLMSR